MLCRVSLIVQSVFGKLDRETMKRTFVQAAHKSLYNFSCFELERVVS